MAIYRQPSVSSSLHVIACRTKCGLSHREADSHMAFLDEYTSYRNPEPSLYSSHAASTAVTCFFANVGGNLTFANGIRLCGRRSTLQRRGFSEPPPHESRRYISTSHPRMSRDYVNTTLETLASPGYEAAAFAKSVASSGSPSSFLTSVIVEVDSVRLCHLVVW